MFQHLSRVLYHQRLNMIFSARAQPLQITSYFSEMKNVSKQLAEMSHCKSVSGENCKIQLNLNHLCFVCCCWTFFFFYSLPPSTQMIFSYKTKPHWASNSDTPWESLTCFHTDQTGREIVQNNL